jgi:hypothetical protein
VLQLATTHAPAAHPAVPFVTVHARLHAPQFATLVRRSTSQPLSVLPSQSANPVAQLATAHAPAAHTAVALGNEQARPHIPQCATLARVSTSQPLLALRSQSAKPASQVMPHAPPAHVGTPWLVEHATPQPPQWFTLFVVLTSQPLPTFWSQSPNPTAHISPTAHALAAQLAESPGGAGHTALHRPQCLDDVSVLVSQPSLGSPLQSPNPAAQLATVHAPILHSAVALQSAHLCLHAPQWFTSCDKSTSQPLVASSSQLP